MRVLATVDVWAKSRPEGEITTWRLVYGWAKLDLQHRKNAADVDSHFAQGKPLEKVTAVEIKGVTIVVWFFIVECKVISRGVFLLNYS